MKTDEQKNGKEAPSASKSPTGEKGLVKTEPKAQTLEVKVKDGPLSVEDTIKRVNELQENIDKRELLRNHLKSLNGLKFGEYDEKCHVILVDGQSRQYAIRSASLSQECVALARQRIEENIEQVEAQIVF